MSDAPRDARDATDAGAGAPLPPGWTLRAVRDADLDALHALRARALREHPDAFGSSPEDHPEPDAYRARHRQREAAGTVTLAVFDAAGAPKGMGALVPGRVRKERHKGTIHAMYVAGEARGRGVGAALLAALVARARAAGLERLTVAVTVGNPARRLYERAGFTVWGVEPCALKVAGRCLDEAWLTLELQGSCRGAIGEL